MEERSCFGITQEESRWPCLGGETDGVVPLKAQHQPTTRPTHPSTPSTSPDPKLIHSLNYSCATQKSDKGHFEVQVREMVVACGIQRLHNYRRFFSSSCTCVHVSWYGLLDLESQKLFPVAKPKPHFTQRDFFFLSLPQCTSLPPGTSSLHCKFFFKIWQSCRSIKLKQSCRVPTACDKKVSRGWKLMCLHLFTLAGV